MFAMDASSRAKARIFFIWAKTWRRSPPLAFESLVAAYFRATS